MLFAIDRVRIEQFVRRDEFQAQVIFAGLHETVKAGVPAGMAGGSRLLDANPDRILIAIGPYLDHALNVT